MTVFFFDLVGPSEREQDELGIAFNNLDQAYLEACRAVVEISRDALNDRLDPNGYRFEVFDEARRLVLEVPFSEVLQPSRSLCSQHSKAVVESLHRNIDTSQRLRADLLTGLQQARESMEGIRALMERSQARD